MLGLVVLYDCNKGMMCIELCKPGMTAAKILQWRSLILSQYLSGMNDVKIHTIEDHQNVCKQLYNNRHSTCRLQIMTYGTDLLSMTNNGISNIYFNQMNIIHSHMPELYDEHLEIHQVNATSANKNAFKRQDFIKQCNWHKWESSE